MNILLISYDYPPCKFGVANISYQIACQLYRFGENIIVVAQKAKGDREFDKNNKFLTYRYTNIFLLRELMLILALPYLAIRYKINIIYLLIWCQGGIATFLTNKFLKIPYIIHAYAAEFIGYKKTLFDKIKYSLLRTKYKSLIIENSKRIIAISNYTKDLLIKLGAKKNKIDIIHLGVDINRFKPDLEIDEIIKKHNLNNKKILLTVSRLDEYKGHDIIINLMPQLLKKIPNIVYLIVGSGKNKVSLESFVKKLRLQNNIIFVGYKDTDLPLYYNACDIFMMLTRERLDQAEVEGFGLVFIEANSCCKPVIGARTGGIPDAIVDGKTGYLVDPNNDQEIINKVILLLEDRELSRRLGKEGRHRIINENFTWESMTKEIQSILASEI